MVAAQLQDALVSELTKMFKDYISRDQYGPVKGINVYSQNLPIPKSAPPPEYDLDPAVVEEGLMASDVSNVPEPFPYIIVRANQGVIETIEGEQEVEFYLLIGVYDNRLDNQGHKDVLNIIQDIYERFSKCALLDHRYECAMPIEWALQDEESYPYYFGGMTLRFLTHPIRREDPYI
ncbi:MAG: hypothetical protein LUC16_02700 [Coprobacillus sp.]|nr:hypothetical protein [Coprobacillus sp.]